MNTIFVVLYYFWHSRSKLFDLWWFVLRCSINYSYVFTNLMLHFTAFSRFLLLYLDVTMHSKRWKKKHEIQTDLINAVSGV